MAIEPKRGCGYRKVGGLYLVTMGAGRPCGKMPIPAEVCPTCNGGIKPTRGWTWIDPVPLFGERACDRSDCGTCPMGPGNFEGLGPIGLIWVGEKFYPKPADFVAEAHRLGISRRVPAVPKGLHVGETWVAFGHRKVAFADGEIGPGLFYLAKPERLEKIVTETQAQDAEEMAKLAKRGITPVIVPDDDPDHNPAGADQAEADLDQVDLFDAAD